MRAEFTENLITGNELIDSQHRELISRINKLLDSCEASDGKVTAINTLDYLSDYTNTHFADEEKLQRDLEYPDYLKHLAQHDDFRKTISELDELLREEEGPSDAFVKKIEENVIQWFYTHIQGFDRSVAEFKFMRENSGRL